MNTTIAPTQFEIDSKNAAFWDELCGSQLARQIGVTDDSPESLAKFDAWYFDLYPYLDDYIPYAEMTDKAVLEIGLGYGSVAQKLAVAGAHYHGLDIASGPVEMAKKRCLQNGVKTADVRQGSILEPPFAPAMFDWVIAIGCLHHTGNLAAAISQVHGLLKPGGRAVVMVYNAASYRQLFRAPVKTVRRLRQSQAGDRLTHGAEDERRSYDANADGVAAPQTEFVTKAELTQLCSAFSEVAIKAENIGAEGPLRLAPRTWLCRTLGPSVGLDLYCRLVK